MTSRDFWLSCGHHLLDRDTHGCLVLTDEFLKAYFARPELMPAEEACTAERDLHGALMANPRLTLSEAQLLEVVDVDARENWQLILAWRDHLLRHSTLEDAYTDMVRRSVWFPHLFIGQLTQVILRNMLNGCDDAYVLRAAELFFRPQKLITHEGSLISADEETHAEIASQVSPLDRLLGLTNTSQIEVLNEDNTAGYFERSDRFDLGLDLTVGRRGLQALGELIALWLRHLLGIEVRVRPMKEVRDAPFKWYLGLDHHATRLGNALWTTGSLSGEDARQLVGLYEIQCLDLLQIDENLAGAPFYLLMAMSPDMKLFLKPQNLVTGLPLRERPQESV